MRIVPKQGVWTYTTPTNTVVSLAEIKSACYIDEVITEDDTMLTNMEKAARNLCEKFLGRPLLSTTVVLYYSYNDILRLLASSGYQYPILGATNKPVVLALPLGRLIGLTKISVWDEDNVETILDSTYYQSSITGEQAEIYFKQYPFQNTESSYRMLDTMTIEVVGGFGVESTSVPEEIRTGITMQIAYMYEHRGDEKTRNYITPAAKALWSTHRIERFK